MEKFIKKKIQAEARAIYSIPMVNAKKELNKIQTMLMDPDTDVNTKAILSTKRGPLVQRMTALRLEFMKVKEATINQLAQRYRNIDKSEIIAHIEEHLAEYERGHLSCTAINQELTDPTSEQVTLTIPAVYEKPTKSDMAVLLVYFNACSYKNLERNLRVTYQSLIDAEIPVFLVEHLFKDQEPIFPENGTTIFNTRSDSYMFYKENLLNWLMPIVPAEFTKFYTMDCDLIFSNPRWYDEVSTLLDTHNVVQPFEDAVWLKSDLETVDLKRLSFIYVNKNTDAININQHQSGFAWAFRRDFIENINLFDISVLGSGDMIFACSCIKNNKINYGLKSYLPWVLPYINRYFNLFTNVSVTYYSQTIYHLWHGSRLMRYYDDRYRQFNDLCRKNNITNKDQLFDYNLYNLYEYKEQYRDEFNKIILDYFINRKEDGILTHPYIIHISEATERADLVKKIVKLTGAKVFEAIVIEDDRVAGCKASHKEIMKMIPAGDGALIFEDDCKIIDPSFIDFIDIEKENYDLIYIGVNKLYFEKGSTRYSSWGTHAMYIGPKAIDIFLKYPDNNIPLDHIWNNIEKTYNLKAWRPAKIYKYVKQQVGLKSYITGKLRKDF